MLGHILDVEDYAYSRRLKRLLLCLDDLDDIVDYLNRNCDKITIAAGSAIAHDGTDDLLDATRRERCSDRTMCALRRYPERSTSSNTSEERQCLGLVLLDRQRLDSIVRYLTKSASGVRVYAGDGLDKRYTKNVST